MKIETRIVKILVTRIVSFLVAIAACFVLQQYTSKSFDTYQQLMLQLAGIYITLAVSLNLINGITGQFSIGHAAFYQIGAYTGAVLGGSFFKSLSTSNPVLFLIASALSGAVTAALAGFIVGLPSLRLKGDYLAVVTLGIGEIVTIIAKNQESLGKAYGLNAVKVPSLFIIGLLAILCIAVCRNLQKTAHGLAFLAVRDDEVASSAMGVSLTKIKVTAFVIGSAFAGAAGALYAHTKGFVGPSDFSMDVSFIILTMVVLGGTGSITGTTIAALALFYIPEKMRDLSDVTMAEPVAWAIGIVIVVAGLKRIQDHYHGKTLVRASINIGIIAAGLLIALGLAKVLGNVSFLQSTVKGSNLRMPVLAVTLVVFMLLRPQGIFGHHEFSWDGLKKLLRRKSNTAEVTA